MMILGALSIHRPEDKLSEAWRSSTYAFRIRYVFLFYGVVLDVFSGISPRTAEVASKLDLTGRRCMNIGNQPRPYLECLLAFQL